MAPQNSLCIACRMWEDFERNPKAPVFYYCCCNLSFVQLGVFQVSPAPLVKFTIKRSWHGFTMIATKRWTLENLFHPKHFCRPPSHFCPLQTAHLTRWPQTKAVARQDSDPTKWDLRALAKRDGWWDPKYEPKQGKQRNENKPKPGKKLEEKFSPSNWSQKTSLVDSISHFHAGNSWR